MSGTFRAELSVPVETFSVPIITPKVSTDELHVGTIEVSKSHVNRIPNSNDTLVFVDDKDDLLKTKDTTGATNALTSLAFGSYIFINPNPGFGIVVEIAGGVTLPIKGFTTISKKEFSDPDENGSIRYKSSLKRAVRVSANINTRISFLVAPSLTTFAIVKSENSFLDSQEIAFTQAPLGILDNFAQFSGDVIFKKVKQGDNFTLVLKTTTGILLSLYSANLTLVSLPKGKD